MTLYEEYKQQRKAPQEVPVASQQMNGGTSDTSLYNEYLMSRNNDAEVTKRQNDERRRAINDKFIDDVVGGTKRYALTAAGGYMTGLGRLAGAAGYGIGKLDELAFDLIPDIASEFPKDLMTSANELVESARPGMLRDDGTMSLGQQVVEGIANSAPSMLLGYGAGALAGGAANSGSFIKTLYSLPSIALRTVSDSFGEAAATEQEAYNQLIQEGYTEDQARTISGQQADRTAISNLALNAATEAVSGGLAKAGGMLPGVAGQLAEFIAPAVIEGVQEPGQDILSEVAMWLDENGMAPTNAQYLTNIYNGFRTKFPEAASNTSLPSFLSAVVTGGAGNLITAISNERARNEYLSQVTPESLNQQFEAWRNGQAVMDESGNLTPVNEEEQLITGALNSTLAGNRTQLPVATEEAEAPRLVTIPTVSELNTMMEEELGADFTDQDRQILEILSNNPKITAEEAVSLSAREELSRMEEAAAGLNVSPTVSPKVPAKETRGETLLRLAEQELTRLTEETTGEYDEDGNLLNPMSQEDASWYSAVARARAQRDLNTLESLLAPMSGSQDQTQFERDMIAFNRGRAMAEQTPSDVSPTAQVPVRSSAREESDDAQFAKAVRTVSDRDRSGSQVVDFGELRKELPGWSREKFDEHFNKLWNSGQVEPSFGDSLSGDNADVNGIYDDVVGMYINGFRPSTQMSGSQDQLVGRKSGISPELFDQAEQMLDEGASARQVREATGIFRDSDGKLKLERPDGTLQEIAKGLEPRIGRIAGKLSQVYSNEAVNAYPGLGDRNLVVNNDPAYDGRGENSSDGIRIAVDKNNPESIVDGARTVVHEVAHDIQDVEGFARGSNPEDLRNPIPIEEYDTPRTRAAYADLAALRKLPDSPAKRARMKSLWQQIYDDYSEHVNQSPDDRYENTLGERRAVDAENRAGKSQEWLDANPLPEYPKATMLGMNDRPVFPKQEYEAFLKATKQRTPTQAANTENVTQGETSNTYEENKEENKTDPEASMKGDYLTIPEIENLRDDSSIYKDVVSKFNAAGIEGAEAQIQGKLYSTLVTNISRSMGLDSKALWDSLGFKVEQSDLSTGKPRPVRGNIDFNGGSVKLTFDLRNRNSSTAMHELGHFMKELIRVSALGNHANDTLREAWGVMNKYVGSDGTVAWTKAQEEKFANAFMGYAFEGKSTNPTLKTVFDKFKSWITDFWSSLTDSEREQASPELRTMFDSLLATDAGFDATYSTDNKRVDNTSNNPVAEVRDAAKSSSSRARELNPSTRESTTTETKGNITTVRKVIDRSDTVNPLRHFNSPNIIAKLYAKFAPVFEMGVAARREQDKLRGQYAHAVDKVFGKAGLFGRKGGFIKTEEDRDEVFNALITGDMFGKDLTDAELTAMGISDNAKNGYRRIRNIYKNLGQKINAQRAKYGKDAMALREGYVPHIFHSYRVHDSDGTIIQTFRTMADAGKFAESIANDDRQVSIRPAMQDFGGKARTDAITLGDLQYFKMVKKVGDTFALSAADAKEFTSDIARMASKSRQFNNARFRQGYAGYNMDMEYAVRHYANLASRYMAMDTFKHDARRYFERAFGRFDRQYKGIASYSKDYINDVLGVPTAWEESENKLIEGSGLLKFLPDDYQDRPALALGQLVTGTTASLKLGFMNVASALINLSSLNSVGAIAGYGRTTSASKEYLSPNLTTKKLYQALGLDTDITMASSSSYSKVGDRIARAKMLGGAASSGLFSVMDSAARKIAAIAGYRKALSEGKTQAQAYAYAREVVDKTNFNYGVEDAPDAFRRHGVSGQLALQFKKYPVKILELGFNHLEGMEKVKFWGGMLVLSGVVGAIPGFTFINMVVKSLFPEKDLELELKRVVNDLPLPNAVKRQLLYGAASNIGLDIGQRMGVGDVLPDQVSDLVGPGLGTIWDIIEQSPKLLDTWGGSLDILQAVTPGISNPLKAFYGETEDLRTGRTRFKYEGIGERLIRATGARPIREAIESDAIRTANYEASGLSKEQGRALKEYIEARESGGDIIATRDRLRELNVKPSQIKRALSTSRLPDSTRYFEEFKKSRSNKVKRDRLEKYQQMSE